MCFTLQWQIGLGETLCYRFVPSTRSAPHDAEYAGQTYRRGPTIRVRNLLEYTYVAFTL